MKTLTSRARAYVNFGRWISDCPNGCGSAASLEPGQTMFHCGGTGGCGQMASVEWPADAQEIWDALEERSRPKNRNWFPDGHELALRAGCPAGQTPEELRREAAEAEKAEALGGEH